MASPFGPPPHSENTLTLPSGVIREHLLLRISVSTTEPSAHTTGPSGKPSPVARIVTSAISHVPPVIGGRECRRSGGLVNLVPGGQREPSTQRGLPSPHPEDLT